jgi:hypothetical protein
VEKTLRHQRWLDALKRAREGSDNTATRAIATAYHECFSETDCPLVDKLGEAPATLKAPMYLSTADRSRPLLGARGNSKILELSNVPKTSFRLKFFLPLHCCLSLLQTGECKVIILTAEVYQSNVVVNIAEFCSHALDSLEDVILEAIRQGFDTFGMTEHMPRDNPVDLYPEEVHWAMFEHSLMKEAPHARRPGRNF